MGSTDMTMIVTEGDWDTFTTYFPSDNHSNVSDHHYHHDIHSLYTYTERIFFATVLSIICVTGIIGNSLTITAVILSKKLRTDTNVFVTCLAVTDLATCIGIPLSVIGLLNKSGWPWPQHEWICAVSAAMLYGGTGSSELCLAVIAINRLLLIKWPQTYYQKVFRKRYIILMVVLIIVGPSFALIVMPLAGFGALGYDEKHNVCSDIDAHPQSRPYELLQVVLLYPITLITIVICYCLIFRYVRHRFGMQRENELRRIESLESFVDRPDGTLAGNGPGDPSKPPPPHQTSPRAINGDVLRQRLQEIDELQYQITHILFTSFCVFFLCVTPYAIALLFPRTERQAYVLLYCGMLVGIGSCVNPIIYAFRHPQFREVFGLVLRCRYRDIPDPVSGSTQS